MNKKILSLTVALSIALVSSTGWAQKIALYAINGIPGADSLSLTVAGTIKTDLPYGERRKLTVFEGALPFVASGHGHEIHGTGLFVKDKEFLLIFVQAKKAVSWKIFDNFLDEPNNALGGFHVVNLLPRETPVKIELYHLNKERRDLLNTFHPLKFPTFQLGASDPGSYELWLYPGKSKNHTVFTTDLKAGVLYDFWVIQEKSAVIKIAPRTR